MKILPEDRARGIVTQAHALAARESRANTFQLRREENRVNGVCLVSAELFRIRRNFCSDFTKSSSCRISLAMGIIQNYIRATVELRCSPKSFASFPKRLNPIDQSFFVK